MTDKTNTHALPVWTEVEYTALCKKPYLLTPFFIPKEAKCFTCREDGTREEERMVFLVFKSTAAPADAEWEDDPIPGEVWVRALGDDDEEIEPAKVVYLGQDIDDFIHVTAEDDQTITFDFWWHHGEVKVWVWHLLYVRCISVRLRLATSVVCWSAGTSLLSSSVSW